MDDYHSFYASVYEKISGKCYVKIVDRYYPGPPGPEYSTMVVLSPGEAIELSKDLYTRAQEAISRQEKIKINKEIYKNTAQLAKEAKKEAYK